MTTLGTEAIVKKQEIVGDFPEVESFKEVHQFAMYGEGEIVFLSKIGNGEEVEIDLSEEMADKLRAVIEEPQVKQYDLDLAGIDGVEPNRWGTNRRFFRFRSGPVFRAVVREEAPRRKLTREDVSIAGHSRYAAQRKAQSKEYLAAQQQGRGARPSNSIIG